MIINGRVESVHYLSIKWFNWILVKIHLKFVTRFSGRVWIVQQLIRLQSTCDWHLIFDDNILSEVPFWISKSTTFTMANLQRMIINLIKQRVYPIKKLNQVSFRWNPQKRRSVNPKKNSMMSRHVFCGGLMFGYCPYFFYRYDRIPIT